jgi:hypothetical protein
LLPNQFGCQISEVYNDSDLAGAYIGIRKNHTVRIDSYNGGDLYNFVQIDLAHQVAPLFAILIVDLIFTVSSHTTQAGGISQLGHTTEEQHLTLTTCQMHPQNTLDNLPQLPTPPTLI